VNEERQVEHIVLFRPKPGATREQLTAMRDGLLALRETISGIVAASCGFNFSERAQGHEVGFVVRFTDRAALEGYLPHPEHRRVVEQLVHPVVDGVIVVDYEV